MSNATKLAEEVISGYRISRQEAEALFEAETITLFTGADRIRERFKGKKVNLCRIINAKSGSCSENCSFCAQSINHKTRIEKYPLVSSAEITAAVKEAVENHAGCFGIVTSGNSMPESEIDKICASVEQLKGSGIKISASIGKLDIARLTKLKKAGLKRFHHNIETAESFFPNICTSHTYADRIATAKAAKQAGLELCCGGLFGLGETRAQRVEFGFALKELDADSVPLNFLNPVEGTPLAGQKPLSPEEILKSIAVMRYILPEKDISVCGGREVNLCDLQSWIFFAGANGMMTGNYLTTSGRGARQDLKMIEDLGFTVNI
jgi:biotin synthase